LVIVFAWVLTAVYVLWANGPYDAAIKGLKDQVKK
jgi:uncharacterized membrane protein (DUF485 family)